MNMHSRSHSSDKGSANRDPITGAPGAHPVGTGIGAAAGGMAAGAAVGTVAGPVGTAIGAAAGAIVGGLAGKGVAERIDPTVEDAYWRDNYEHRPYVQEGSSYDDYGPAYRYGVDLYNRHPGMGWDDTQADLAGGWDSARGNSRLSWEQARHASRDSWQRLSDRVERAMPGDSDRDGK
ncbi:hypothetical protein [Eleftheria terrae]|uniref:hypothetical protein n=1 Tax=Eleftheria terrae TaxID=1597781 RepID=UPI00263B40C9|nr:hypothetical protein [Eleftheria terrae]WKB55483.1 hypothetical protein N7L95_25740 [Eleftheria terrae]